MKTMIFLGSVLCVFYFGAIIWIGSLQPASSQWTADGIAHIKGQE